MIKLIKNEYYKLFRKKSTKVIFILVTIFILIVSLFYKLSITSLLERFYENYILIIIIIFIFMGCSSISDEYKFNTMKNYLIQPYSRNKLLLCKYVSYLSISCFFIFYMIFIQVIIGGLISGFNLSSNIYFYGFNIYQYILLVTFINLIQFIFIYSISFLFTLIIKNNIVNMLMYLFIVFTELVNNFIYTSHNRLFSLILTANWDFNYLISRSDSVYQFSSTFSSVICCIVYYILIVVLSFVIFNRIELKK